MMCTVTVIPREQGCRIVMNRDESPGRAAGLPPRSVVLGGQRVLMPIDAASGGTWVAASEAGYGAALLNHYAGPVEEMAGPRAGQMSRGGIVPTVMTEGTFLGALERACGLPAGCYADFRLLLIDGDRVAEVINEGGELRVKLNPLAGRPWLAGSALSGDEVAQRPRRKLMDHAFGPSRERWPREQDLLHRRACANHGDLSLRVKADPVQTVSITTAWWSDAGVVMSYHSLDEVRRPVDSDHCLTPGGRAMGCCQSRRPDRV